MPKRRLYMSDPQIKTIDILELVDLSHRERIYAFLPENELNETNEFNSQKKLTAKKIKEITQNEMDLFRANKISTVSTQELDTLIQSLEANYLQEDVKFYDKEYIDSVIDNIKEMHKQAIEFSREHKPVDALRELNDLLGTIKLKRFLLNNNDDTIEKLLFSVALYIEYFVIYLIDNKADISSLQGTNAFLYRNDFTENDIEVENEIENTNINASSQKEKAYVLGLFNKPRRSALSAHLPHSFYYKMDSNTPESIKPNPILLHTVINAKIIAAMSAQQRLKYVQGVIQSYKDEPIPIKRLKI